MSDPETGPTARTALVGLALLLLVALLLRWPALDRNLPCDPEPDAVVVKQALYLDAKWRHEERSVPALNTQYPPLLALGLAALPGSLAPQRADGEAAHERAAAGRAYRVGRLYVLLLALGAIPATYALARRALGTRYALVAAGLVASSSIHALYSTQARPHAPLATFVALALLALAARLRAPSAWTALLSGLACATAVACLHNGAAVLVPLAAVELVLALRSGWRSSAAALLALAPVGVAAYLSYPELLGRINPFEYAVPHVSDSVNLSGHLLRVEDFNGAGFLLVLQFLVGQEPLLFLLLAAGACALPGGLRAARTAHGGAGRALVSAEHAEVFVALVFALAYLLALGVYERTFGRFLLPVLPALAFGAAWAAKRWLAPRGALGHAAPWALLALAALPAGRLAILWSRPTTQQLAAAWLSANVPEDALVAAPLGLDVGLPVDLQRAEVVPAHLRTPWTAHLLRHPDVAAGLRGPRLLHSGYMPGLNQLGPGAEGLARELRSRVGAQFVLVEPDEAYVFDPRRGAAGLAGALDPSYRPEIGKRRFPRGHHPEDGARPLVTFGDASAPKLSDPLGYALDDCRPWTLWRLSRFGERLEVHRDWASAERGAPAQQAPAK